VKEESNSIDKAARDKKARKELKKKVCSLLPLLPHLLFLSSSTKLSISQQLDAGPKWFGMKTPNLSDEQLTEVKLIKLQHVLDKNYKYHKNDDVIPKHFEVFFKIIIFKKLLQKNLVLLYYFFANSPHYS
jgi:hypothetical protein